MVRLLCAVAAVALAVPMVATAQQSRHDNNRYDNNRHDNNGHDNNRHDNNRNHQSSRNYGTYRIGHRPTTFRRVNVSSYRYPSGYHYRPWSVGAVLPSLFLSNSYYFNNYGSLGSALRLLATSGSVTARTCCS